VVVAGAGAEAAEAANAAAEAAAAAAEAAGYRQPLLAERLVTLYIVWYDLTDADQVWISLVPLGAHCGSTGGHQGPR
jgi:hypothetical protein